MASNMTKAFQAKAKRGLGCRPGYAGGGTTDVYQTGSNSFGDQGGALLRMGNLGGATEPTPAPTPAPMGAAFAPTPAVGTGQSLGQSAPGVAGEGSMISNGPLKSQGSTPLSAFADTPQGNIALAKAKMMENGMSEATYAQFHSPDAVMQRDAAQKVQDKMRTATSRELDMLAGHDPHASFKYDKGGNKVYKNETGETRAAMRGQGMTSLGFAGSRNAPGALGGGMATPEMQFALRRQVGAQLGTQSQSSPWGFADGGAVPKEDPVEALLRKTSQTYGLPATQPAPQPAPAPAPQPEQRRGLGDIIRERTEELKRATKYADGGTVRQFEFEGEGGPRDDKIPVRFAGADIRVSDGERGLILPAKTAANPHAVDAIEDIIQGSNDGRSPRRGLAQGGHYADGLDLRTAQGAYEAGRWSPEATRFRAERGFAGEPGPAAQPVAEPASGAQPQNIAPEIQMPPEPAPAAEPQVRRGLFSRIPGAIKSGAQNLAGKALDMEPKAQVAEPVAATTSAPTAPQVEKSPTPITDRAKALGTSLGKGEVPGLIKVDAAGNRYLTKGGGAGMGAGAALQFGDHFDAFDTREGGLSHPQRAQLFARDAGIIGSATAGGTALGTVGSFFGPVGTVVGGVTGAIGGAVLGDKGMGKIRAGANWANEKLGGAPNYFEDSDEMIARDRANREALGVKEGGVQSVVRPVNSAVGAIMQSTGLVSKGEPSEARTDTSNYSNEGRGREQIDPSQVEPINRGGRAQVRGIDNALAALTPEDVQRQRILGVNTGNAGKVSAEKDGNMIRFQADKGDSPTNYKFAPGTGMATVTGAAANGGRMMPGVKRNALGTSIAVGPGNYTAKDGSDTSDWYKTQAYEDAMRRNAQNRVDLSQIQNERAGRDPMVSRALGQQMMPPGEDAATDTSSRDALLQSAMKNLASSNPGTRALGQQHMAAYDHLAKQALALSKAQWERSKDVTEMGAKGNELAMKQEESFRKSVEADPLFQKTVDGKQSVDTEKAGQYVNLLNSTMRHAHDEAPEGQKALFFNSVTKKARGAGELDPVQREILRNRFDIMGRVMSKAGGWFWDGPNQTSDDLRDWEPTDIGDGKVEFKRLSKKFGKSVVIPKSYLEYEGGALSPLSPSRLFATQTSQYLPTEQGAK